MPNQRENVLRRILNVLTEFDSSVEESSRVPTNCHFSEGLRA